MKIGKTGHISISRDRAWWGFGCNVSRSRLNRGWCAYLTIPGWVVEMWTK